MEQLADKDRALEITPQETVRVGSVVEIHYADDPEDAFERLLIIDNPNNSKPGITLLASSNLGQAILGKEKDTTIEFIAPNKNILFITIVSIENN